MDAISPDVDDWLAIERCALPGIVFHGPIPLEPRDRICRQSRRVWAQHELEDRGHFTAGYALEIKPEQRSLQCLGSAHIRQHQGGSECQRRAVFEADLVNTQAHKANTFLNWALWMVAIANDRSVASLRAHLRKLRHVS